jgi:hypothetical protein
LKNLGKYEAEEAIVRRQAQVGWDWEVWAHGGCRDQCGAVETDSKLDSQAGGGMKKTNKTKQGMATTQHTSTSLAHTSTSILVCSLLPPHPRSAPFLRLIKAW